MHTYPNTCSCWLYRGNSFLSVNVWIPIVTCATSVYKCIQFTIGARSPVYLVTGLVNFLPLNNSTDWIIASYSGCSQRYIVINRTYSHAYMYIHTYLFTPASRILLRSCIDSLICLLTLAVILYCLNLASAQFELCILSVLQFKGSSPGAISSYYNHHSYNKHSSIYRHRCFPFGCLN